MLSQAFSPQLPRSLRPLAEHKDSRGNQPPALGRQGPTYIDIQGNVVLSDIGRIDHEVANLGLRAYRFEA